MESVANGPASEKPPIFGFWLPNGLTRQQYPAFAVGWLLQNQKTVDGYRALYPPNEFPLGGITETTMQYMEVAGGTPWLICIRSGLYIFGRFPI